jgi:hypothetical protein
LIVRRAALLVALAVLAVACPADPPTEPPSPTRAAPSPSPVAASAATAEEAIAAVCVPPDVDPPEPVEPAPVPEDVEAVIGQVEEVRELEFLRPVAVQAITDEEMDRRLEDYFAEYYPREFYDRRTAAWRTIGVIPQDADLHAALQRYFTGQVVGFYDPARGELVYLRDGDLSLTERLVLAHELTHALDDQHFDLTRLDELFMSCRDEEFMAALGAVEGSAQFFAEEVLVEFPTLELSDVAGALLQSLGAVNQLAGVPPFVQELQGWPYRAGRSFVATRAADGTEAVDETLRNLPATTEQVLHPEAYPDELPSAVDIPDVTPALGAGWGDLDAMQVGEAWLRAMLALRLAPDEADAAAAGWDGAVYRAWSDGSDVVVVLRTAWDDRAEADAFARAATRWQGEGGPIGAQGRQVDLVFASDDALRDAAADAVARPRP